MVAQQIRNVEFSKQFKKQFKKLSPKIQAAFFERTEVFKVDSFEMVLNNHPLSGRWSGFRSINVSGDIRAIYEEIFPNIAKFYAIGTHSQLYG